VYVHVFLALAGRPEGSQAEGALVGLNDGVDVHVSRQGPIGGEERVAEVTLVLLDARVGAQVLTQHAHRHKRLVTLITLVWLLTCVHQRYKCL